MRHVKYIFYRKLRRLSPTTIIFLAIVTAFILYELLHNRSQKQWARFIEKEAEWNKFERSENSKQGIGFHSKRKSRTPVDPPKPGEIFKKDRDLHKKFPTQQLKVKPTEDDTIPYVDEHAARYTRPPCKIKHKDSLSAIDRAKTDQCKIELADVACRHQGDQERLDEENKKLGVKLHDQKEAKSFNKHPKILDDSKYTPHNTWDQVLSAFKPSLLPVKVHYACPVKAGTFQPSHSDDNYLGKPHRELDIKQFNYLSQTNAPTVRITYLLILHGRSLRQITRMFRTIYTTHDHYILHVDARSEYLYHSLREIFDALQLKNVIFQKNRYTPIWGGVSLLTTIKDAIAQSLRELGEWDYLVNLSFADFPIEHGERLRAFLTQNNGKTFCKAHGREHEKFVKKQGLNKLFYECENRMWRLGDREIPKHMQLDGGSDWFALHRSLCEYSVSDVKDGVLENVNYWFNYTLLPAESYFHTLLKTSTRCKDLVDNNLRVTNWNRARGCKCQYKAIVDWCGCSPNDFTPYDVDKVFRQKRAVFFARKFEESVSQKPINIVHERVFGSDGKDEAWSSYWESVWERKFDAKDEHLNHVFRMFSEFAGVNFGKVQSVSMFKRDDIFEGYVIQTEEDEYFVKSHGTKPDIRKPGTLVSNSIAEVGVGSNWDVKELIFRDWGGIVTTDKKGHLSVMWHRVTQEFKVACIVIGPNGKVVSSADLTLAKGNTVITADELKLEQPYQIGVYRLLFVELHEHKISEMDWEYDAESLFIVLPGVAKSGNNLADDVVELPVKNRKYHLDYVNNEMNKHGIYEASEFKNIKDSYNLLLKRWEFKGSCSKQQDCHHKYWSTEFPDKKSSIIDDVSTAAELKAKYSQRMIPI